MFDHRLKDLIVDEVIVTPGTDAGGNTHVQLNGVMWDGSTAWMSIIIRPNVVTTKGQPFEDDDEEGELIAARLIASVLPEAQVGDYTNLPPARPEVSRG